MPTLQQEYGLRDFEKQMLRKFMEGRERSHRKICNLLQLSYNPTHALFTF